MNLSQDTHSLNEYKRVHRSFIRT